MKNKFNNIIQITGKKNFVHLIFLSFLLIILSLFEFVGVGAIPVFMSIILDPQILASKIDIPFIVDYINSSEKGNLILISSAFLVIVFLIKNLFYVFIIYYQGQLTKKIKLYLSIKVYKKYLNLDYLSLIEKNSAVLIRSLTNDVGNTSTFVLNIINLFRETVIFLAICALLFYADPLISFVMLVFFGLVSFLFFLRTHKAIYHQGKSLQYLSSDKIKVINNTIGSIKEIKIFKLEKFLEKIYSNNAENYEKFAFKNYFIKFMPRVVLEIGAVSGIIFLIVFYVLLEKNLMSLLPFLSLVVVSIIRIVPGLNLIQNSLSTLKTIMPSYNHVIRELSFKDESIQPITDKKESIQFKNKIELKNISFNYPFNEKNIINKFSLEIFRGDKIGIVGKSGSGKTTLVSLLLGLIKPKSGKILIDDKEINFSKYEWNNIAGYVPQDIFLLEDTIKNNITFGLHEKDIELDKVVKACKLAQIENFVNSLPKKLDTIIGEKGYNLSAGQRQRLGIARVLYRNPVLLVLDESTSSLDQETEKNFIDDVFNLSKDKTIIFISHKLSALKNCNKIYDLNNFEFIK